MNTNICIVLEHCNSFLEIDLESTEYSCTVFFFFFFFFAAGLEVFFQKLETLKKKKKSLQTGKIHDCIRSTCTDCREHMFLPEDRMSTGRPRSTNSH